jgi:hypothetical protein
MSDDLFPETRPTWAETPKAEKLSPDRARTQRAQQRIARGVHPFGMKLRVEPGETCGSCAQLITKEMRSGVRHFKCALVGDTNGPGTDARKSWPACERWERAA